MLIMIANQLICAVRYEFCKNTLILLKFLKYLQQMNNLWAAEERISMIEQEMTELKKEKKSLENQLDRIKPVGDDGTDQKLVYL